MPGHGHQDCGAFEVHFDGIPIFIDPGRGTYGEIGEAALCRSASVHNTLTIDGKDPFPANKPYFDDAFRRKISGPPPVLERSSNGVILTHYGYARLQSVGSVSRSWSFDKCSFTISDKVDGSGSIPVERILCTALDVEENNNVLVLKNKDVSFQLSFDPDIKPNLEKGMRWTAYGKGEPATFIHLAARRHLPWQGTIVIRKL